jgi:DNA repair protein RecO (recombination protein O)
VSAIERVEMEAVFLLHTQPYRETSQLLEVFSRDHGRVGLVANGSRRPKSRWKSALRPFQPVRMSWSGRGPLFTLRAAEPSSPPARVEGDSLMAAFYMNELLIKLIHRGDAHPNLFTHYAGALACLSAVDDTETVLRRFEVSLLDEIGYGLITDHDVVNNEALVSDRKYEYVIDRGPVPVPDSCEERLVFTGSELLAIARGVFETQAQLKSAKRLLRAALNRNLGGRPLKTRAVLASMRR